MSARIDTVSYTRFDMGVILVYIQCNGCYPRIEPDKYVYMRTRINTMSYTRFDMAVILVYIQCDGCYPWIYPMRGWVYPRRTPVAWVYPRRTPVSIRVWSRYQYGYAYAHICPKRILLILHTNFNDKQINWNHLNIYSSYTWFYV